MSHPRICPCSNCIGTGKAGGTAMMLVGLAAAGYAVVQLSRFSAWAGRVPFLVAGVSLTGLVAFVIVVAIRSSVASGRRAVEPVAQKAHENIPADIPAEPEPVVDDVTPELEEPVEAPRLRVLRGGRAA